MIETKTTAPLNMARELLNVRSRAYAAEGWVRMRAGLPILVLYRHAPDSSQLSGEINKCAMNVD